MVAEVPPAVVPAGLTTTGAPTGTPYTAPPATYPPAFLDSSLTSHRPTRVIMHVDCDCFYASVESQRHPHFLHSPLGVIQNGTLCVTTNYHCRARGLPKMGPPADFAALCPSMQFAGSDMVRYRLASRQWAQIFRSFKGVVVMKRSIDEAYLDLTAVVRQRIKQGLVYTPIPHRDPTSLTALAQSRHAKATALFQAEEAALQERFGVIEPHLLESSGTITAAVRASKSTDPISQLREQQRTAMSLNAEEDWTRGKMAVDERVKAMTEAEIEVMCEDLHPVDYCRAHKAQKGPIELVLPQDDATPTRGKAVQGLPWRPWVGQVALSPAEDAVPEEGDDEEERVAPPVPTEGAVAAGGGGVEGVASLFAPPVDFSLDSVDNPSDDFLLLVGSQVAFDIRQSLFVQMGLTTSAGIAPNPMLAKLASSMHKPNQQSIVRRQVAQQFIAPIALSKVSGFGPKASERVAAADLHLVASVQRKSYGSLVSEFGERFGQWLWAIGQGEDETVVEETGPPKSIGQSKRQKTVTEDDRLNLLYWLASKLYERIEEDEKEYSRYPTTLSLGYIFMGTWDICSRRVAIPYLSQTDPVQFLYETAITLLRENVPGGVPLRCLSLTVSGFVPMPTAKAISSYFVREGGKEGKEGATEGVGEEVVPLTANPYVGPSFTARYRQAKALVKQKKPTPHLFSQTRRPNTLHAMMTKGVEGKDGEKTREEVVEEAEDASLAEDEITSLFGDPPSTPQLTAATASVPLPSPPPPSLPPAVLPSSTFLCPQCQRSLPLTSQTEHADWHFAQSLQAEVRAADRAKREAEEEERKKARKGGKASAGALDRFVVPTPPPPVRGVQQGKRGGRQGDSAASIGSFFRLPPDP